MTDLQMQALRNAAASSAMEGLPVEPQHMEVIERILNGDMTLEDYFRQLQSQQENSGVNSD